MKSATRRAQIASSLIVSCLQKRLVSSIEAFSRTLKVHRGAVQRALEKAETETAPREVELTLLRESPAKDDDRAELSDDDICAEEDSQMEIATSATIGAEPSNRDLAALCGIEAMVACVALYPGTGARHQTRPGSTN